MRKLENVDQVKAYIKKWAGIKTGVQMAADLNVSTAPIEKYAKEVGVKLTLKSQQERYERIQAAVLEHHMDMTVREIADMVQAPPMTVKYHGNLLGVEFKSFRRGPGKVYQHGEFFNERAKENWLI